MERENDGLSDNIEELIKDSDMVKDRKNNRNRYIKCEFEGCGDTIRSDNMKKHIRSHLNERSRSLITGRFIKPGEVPPGEVPPGEVPPGEVPPGEVPPGEVPPGEVPPGEVPPGEVPPGEVPPGEVPPGEVPVNIVIGKDLDPETLRDILELRPPNKPRKMSQNDRHKYKAIYKKFKPKMR